MDNLVFEESINTEVPSSEFVEKQYLYVNDNNNSSYTGQIVIDTTALSNCGSYINWSEAFLSVPLVLQVQAANPPLTAALAVDYLVGLKSGYWQLLHSLTCEFNNGNIIQQVPFLNVFCSFKNLTAWSNDDLKNWGALCGFYPDTPKSWIFNNAASANTNTMCANGTGLSNNRTAPYVFTTILAGTTAGNYTAVNTNTYATQNSTNIPFCVNAGLTQRIEWLNYNLTTNSGGALTQGSSNKAVLLSGANASPAGYNQTFQSYITAAATYRAIIFDAIIRLKDVADFFNKVPMLKGSTMRMYLNTNQAYFTASAINGQYAAATAAQATPPALCLQSQPVILGGGGTNPIMLSSVDLGQGGANLVPYTSNAAAAAVAPFSVGLSIVKTQFSQFTNTFTAPITSVRLYAPAYTLSPIAEQRYLSLTPTKKVIYNDIFQYQFSGIANGNFSVLVTNGIPNIRGVLCAFFLPQSSNGLIANDGATAVVPGTYGGAAADVYTSTLLSPFTTTGGTPDPISITNFNIQVSGRNLFINNLQYNFELFTEQFAASNQINGGLTTGLSAGLIGYDDWTYLYRYYYGNCSRSIPSEDGVAKAIQVLGINECPYPVNMMVFVEFEREITIDVRTGARIQ
jgi:hypothetical protein